ncbi:TPA: hypothetical protein JG946_003772 [Enterobacter hormaechei subsp. steigerwaltii]|nr:hypothetical protein [Enterobacter hormaechei subsp. steigerwaltii]
MDLEAHFEGETPYITLDGHTPYANSKPIENMFMNKQVKKELKNSGYKCSHFMNVIYEKKKALRKGDTYTWKLRDMEFNVVLLGKAELFVKGKHVYVYCVGIME